MLLQGVYGDLLHHNYGSHLDGGVAEDAVWKHRWHQLAMQSSRWYDMCYVAVGRQFTSILATEWQVVQNRSWNYERFLVFAHVVITKTLVVRRARKIRVMISRRVDLWDRGIHMGLVWGYKQ